MARVADAPPRPEPAVSRGRGAVTHAEFQEMARDLALPEKALARFVSYDRVRSRPFGPQVRLDPGTVRRSDGGEIRAEGALETANGVSRWRRQSIFRLRRSVGVDLPVLVSEGDSWFQFPVLIEDIVDQLDEHYLVWSVDAGGDTLENMVGGRFPEYLTALRETEGRMALLFSGGGNDLVGEDAAGQPVLERVLKPFEKGRPAEWYVDTAEYEQVVRHIENCFRTLLGRVAKEFPGLPVVLHGYDYSIPGPAPNEWRRPVWASVDEWLGRPFRTRGILDHKLQRRIIKKMIDDLNKLQIRLCGEGVAADGKYKDAYHVDIRGTLDRHDWADELHPTDAGFAKVAARFRDVLNRIGV